MNARIRWPLHLCLSAIIPACVGAPVEDQAVDSLTLPAPLTPPVTPTPTPPSLNLRRVLSVDVGDDHSCVVTSCGEVRCWGRNTNGQAASRNDLVYAEVVAGAEHTCARDIAGAIRCWGLGSSGQTSVPALVDGPASQLSARDHGTTALFAHPLLLTPGASRSTALSWGLAMTGASPSNVIAQGQLSVADVYRVWSGGALACASDLRSFFCVGDDTFSQRSTAWRLSEQGPADPQLDLFRHAWKASMSVGRRHACAVLDDVSVYGVESDGWLLCWGDDGAGQASALGFYPGSPTQRGSGAVGPVRVIDYNGWRDVAAGAAHTCALHRDAVRADGGNVVCFGANGAGQSSAPASTFTQVSAGRLHSCGVSAGRVLCWGDNTFGQSAPPAMPASCLQPW